MDPADIQRLKDIGHVLPHVVVAGKFPTRHITEEIQQLLHSRFAIVVVDGKPKFHCYNCKWSSLQKGHTRPLEHVCLEVPVKEPTWPVIFFCFVARLDVVYFTLRCPETNHILRPLVSMPFLFNQNASETIRSQCTNRSMALMQRPRSARMCRAFWQSTKGKGTEPPPANVLWIERKS